MLITVDTSAILAVLINESHRNDIIKSVQGHELIAPHSVHWEIGNALSAMIKRGKLTYAQSAACVENYKMISLRFVDVALTDALELTDRHRMYAYDAYLIVCSQRYSNMLLTLDSSLSQIASKEGITLLEI